MANLILKPSTGGVLKIQNDDGTVDALSVSTGGNLTAAGTLGVTGNTTLSGSANNLGTVTAGTFNSTIGSSATFPSGSIVNYHKELYSTRTSLATALVGTLFTFSFDKKNASSDLIVEGYIPTYTEYNGNVNLGFKYGTSAGIYGGIFSAGASYVNSYFSGKLTGHTTTGSQTMSIQWTGTESLKPANIFCPNANDNVRLVQSIATASVFEVM
jgi:hypothetical protein